jgi:hypothetical protein
MPRDRGLAVKKSKLILMEIVNDRLSVSSMTGWTRHVPDFVAEQEECAPWTALLHKRLSTLSGGPSAAPHGR